MAAAAIRLRSLLLSSAAPAGPRDRWRCRQLSLSRGIHPQAPATGRAEAYDERGWTRARRVLESECRRGGVASGLQALDMLDQLAIASLNHLLREANWARSRLAEFADKVVRCEVGPVRANLCVSPDGTLQPATADVVPDATIRLRPFVAVRLALLKDESARADIDVDGDTALAGA